MKRQMIIVTFSYRHYLNLREHRRIKIEMMNKKNILKRIFTIIEQQNNFLVSSLHFHFFIFNLSVITLIIFLARSIYEIIYLYA